MYQLGIKNNSMNCNSQSKILVQIRFCVFFFLVCTSFSLPQEHGSTGNTLKLAPSTSVEEKPLVLILDVDNTLYSEHQARKKWNLGVEQQIVQNTHSFCQRHFGMSKEDADDLYRQHGSTNEGLRQLLLENSTSLDEIDKWMRKFYSEVYNDVDVSALILTSSSKHPASTGYTHSSQQTSLKDLLSAAPCPIYLASNSPSWHVHNVLRVLGLDSISWSGILTPDTIVGSDDKRSVSHPTKAQPDVFYREILEKHPNHRLVLIEDSKANIRRSEELGIEGVHVSHKDRNLEQALAVALGYFERGAGSYHFSDIQYLSAKNKVDALSINPQTWEKVAVYVSRLLAYDGTLRIADLGAGIMSMLELIMMGTHSNLPPMDFLLESRDSPVREVHYYAYESNLNLLEGCLETLNRLGFVCKHKIDRQKATAGDTYVFRHARKNITVHLRLIDFTENEADDIPPPHLIVGCCFADLFDPNYLIQSLHRFLQTWKMDTKSSKVLAYFPITFEGVTQFHPPKPFAFSLGKSRSIPSDTAAFRIYADALTNKLGHNLVPNLLIDAVEAHGGTLLSRGPSNWKIDPVEHSYLWDTMMYFFGSTAAPELTKKGWDAVGWLHRARRERPEIFVSNADLLFELPLFSSSLESKGGQCSDNIEGESREQTSLRREIQFLSPFHVSTKELKDDRSLGPNQVEITSVCSLISSGTELKIFKGTFDDAALDVNIDGMEEERMAYPLAYGYSLVGRISKCGSDVKDAEQILGKLAFSFSPHSSHAIVNRESLQIVPDGIEAHDAIFMPSVETALSIVHDAHIRLGEKVAVFGQGLIGLLVTSILSLQRFAGTSGKYGSVSVFDTLPDRLAAASIMGASEALLPSEVSEAGPFDVAIEISGNARALQSAIDSTVSGGRVVVGSWYGNTDVSLKLGIDFHRSHKTIKTSQVSEIPAELTALWSKERRFGLTWEIVRQIRPSRLITRRANLEQAQEAYEALDKGSEISVCFDYTI